MQNIRISAKPGIEPGTLWLEGRDLTNCANHARPDPDGQIISYPVINGKFKSSLTTGRQFNYQPFNYVNEATVHKGKIACLKFGRLFNQFHSANKCPERRNIIPVLNIYFCGRPGEPAILISTLLLQTHVRQLCGWVLTRFLLSS